MSKKILVIGGTGMLGRPVANRLLLDGFDVTVMSHNTDRAERLFEGRIPVVYGDVTDIESLREPISQTESVYINLNGKMDLADYDKIEHQGTVNIASVAKEVGVGQIAMISGLSVKNDNTKFAFLNAKARAEKALIDSGVPYTILRCGWFYESLPLFVTGKQATVFGKQPHLYSWLSSGDYSPMVSKIFEMEKARNRIFHVRGMEKHTIGDALKIFCEICYPDAKLVRIPLWTVSFISKLSRKGAMKGIVKFMKYFNSHPEVQIDADDDTEAVLGPALTTLKDWAENYRIGMMTK